jgi:hypothetical protein
MAGYVQYHNPDGRGRLEPPKSGAAFTFSTNKKAKIRRGDTTWLITRAAGTSEFYLAQVFRMDSFGPSPEGPMKFRGRGMQGLHFRPEVRLDVLPWFAAFKASMANFSFGLQPVPPDVLANLQAARSAGSGVAHPTPDDPYPFG